jgi:hypothetical protein
MTMTPQPPNSPDSPDGPEKWVREAIAEQEEHLKRIRSCGGILGRSHAFRPHGRPGPDGSIPMVDVISRCIACGVTETPQDYRATAQ